MKLAHVEGIIPPGKRHAIAEVIRTAPQMRSNGLIIVNLPGAAIKTSPRSQPKPVGKCRTEKSALR